MRKVKNKPERGLIEIPVRCENGTKGKVYIKAYMSEIEEGVRVEEVDKPVIRRKKRYARCKRKIGKLSEKI